MFLTSTNKKIRIHLNKLLYLILRIRNDMKNNNLIPMHFVVVDCCPNDIQDAKRPEKTLSFLSFI